MHQIRELRPVLSHMNALPFPFLPFAFVLLVSNAVCFAQKPDSPALTPLFNGKNLDGWQTPDFPECWTVAENGVLHLANNEKKKGDILLTKRRFRDVVCELEFKFGAGTIDSGIFLRNQKEQIQIGISGSLKRDLTASPYIPGKGYPVEALNTPERKKLLKATDWNHLKIRAVGQRYTTWLNGTEVMNYTSATAAEEGPLGIQLHGNRDMSISFRNLKATDLK